MRVIKIVYYYYYYYYYHYSLDMVIICVLANLERSYIVTLP